MQSYAPSIKELKEVCRKARWDPMWISNVLWRPVSLYITWLLLRLGISSNVVTMASCISAVIGGVLLFFTAEVSPLIAVVFLEVFTLLDDVDGEVGRYQAFASQRSAGDLTGKYFDLLVHYFQGPLMYVGLGGGLTIATGEPIWVILGALSSVGSGGFPRFVAIYATVDDIHKKGGDWLGQNELLNRIVPFHALHGADNSYGGRFYLIPRSRRELVHAAKQYLTFPGNIHLFALCVVIDGWTGPGRGVFAQQAYLALYTLILVVNTMFASTWYLRRLRAPGDLNH